VKVRLLMASVVLVLAVPAVAAPGDMTVATFLAKAAALKQKGPLALMSPDLSLLRREGAAAGQTYRARLVRERAAGKPSSCPPKGVKVDSDKLIVHLRSYPADQRASTTMNAAVADYFIRTYPCP
jgi:hypothetical protein